MNRSNALEEALARGNFVDFCNAKVTKSKDDMESQIWKFLKVSFFCFFYPFFFKSLLLSLIFEAVNHVCNDIINNNNNTNL